MKALLHTKLLALLRVGLFILAASARAAEPDYLAEIEKWQEVAVPSETQKAERRVWFYSANYSMVEWRVFSDDGRALAERIHGGQAKRPDKLRFLPKAGRFQGGSAFASVDDGWLVGFNQGEFGAALYWFSQDGKRSYKISGHQVVDFVSRPDGIYAIEGLAHMGMSVGSVIRVSRATPGAHWKAETVVKLPFAPYALSVRGDGTMLITLSDSVVSVGPDHTVHTLLAKAPWGGLYPNSSLISADETRLYIGMRQFVGEFDLKNNKLRLLVPSAESLNKLPKEVEEQMRKQ